MFNGNVTVIRLVIGLTKKDIIEINEYFPKPKSLGGNVKVELEFLLKKLI